jgi:hypothetical protein
VKINFLTTTTLSIVALLGLAAPACGGDDGNSEGAEEASGSESTGADTGTESGDTTTSTTDATSTETTGNDDPTVAETTTTTTEETGGDLPNGSSCTSDGECMSGNCYVVPFLGGQCGECNEDADCADTTGGGCTPPNPFETSGSTCNMGEVGGGCESSDVCQDGLSCGNVLDLLGLIQINTCGECADDSNCMGGDICAPIVVVSDFSGVNSCIMPGSLEQDAFCKLAAEGGNGDAACMSGICSTIDIMGLASIGACGECNEDADCGGNGTCVAGTFDLDTAALSGSTCQ